MERKVVLRVITETLKKAESKGGVTELLFKPKLVGNKRRSIFFAETNHDDAIQIYAQILASESVTQHFEPEIEFYENLDELEESALIDPKLNKLENNWRGRLFKDGEVDLLRESQIKKLLLDATWRVIVNQDSGGDFYVRHDIYPAFYLPGFSVAGFDQFKSSLASSIDTIVRGEGRLIDKDFDIIKFFGKNSDSSIFHSIRLTGIIGDIKASDLLDAEEFKKIIRMANSAYDQFFS